MKNSLGEVIYIGKAKNIRNRLRGYFNNTDTRYSINFLLSNLDHIEIIVTEDERQALILENDLIKKVKPKYNIRLKDDKEYLYIKIDFSSDWPRIELVRQRNSDNCTYIGPYVYSYELRALIDVIKNISQLRTCTDHVLNNRVRPCMEYQIKRCLAPCCLQVNGEEYLDRVKLAQTILEGRNNDVVDYISSRMEKASEELRFEDAASWRDKLKIIQRIIEDRPKTNFGEEAKDAFGISREGKNVVVSVLMTRYGRITNQNSFSFNNVEVDDSEILSSVISQYYFEKKDLPSKILIPFQLENQSIIAEYLNIKSENLDRLSSAERAEIIIPKGGSSLRLLKLAHLNSSEIFQSKFGKNSSDNLNQILAEELELDQVPRTIECLDVSHLSGTDTVGTVIHFKDGKPEKSLYRRYKLAQDGKPDDFASIREIILRHLSRALEEGVFADLLIIDGGLPQLRAAIKAQGELGLSLPRMIAIAKERDQLGRKIRKSKTNLSFYPERVYLDLVSPPRILSTGSNLYRYITGIRDEAHRFSIDFQRSLRRSRIYSSALDQIPGIGPERKKRLLRIFGSLKKLSQATSEEISLRGKVPKRIADLIVLRLSGKI